VRCWPGVPGRRIVGRFLKDADPLDFVLRSDFMVESIIGVRGQELGYSGKKG
jgi:hypothetical protein